MNTTPTFSECVRAFWRIGCLSFGGPAGQIALMQREIVDQRGWVDQGAFLRALNLCHLLPGPEAQQLAIWLGWKLHGLRGGLAAGLLFVIPGALVMFALSLLYVLASGIGWVAAVFFGVKCAVLAVVAQALLRIAGRALGTPFKLGVAIVAFLALTLFHAPFPLVIIGAALAGALAGQWREDWLGTHHTADRGVTPIHGKGLWLQTLKTIIVWLVIWFAPMALIALTLGQQHPLWQIGAFFSRLAVVSFGGAYAVLSYMAQAAVGHYHWLSAADMANGLVLAETTPGPLIMVTQYTGFLAAWRLPAPFSPLVAGTLAAALTTWVTFAPCFLWIFTAAPWLERLEHARKLQAALTGITAAIVGVIGNLSLWFALHVLFTRPEAAYGLPDWASADWRAIVISAISALLLFRFKRSIPQVLGAAAVLGLIFANVP